MPTAPRPKPPNAGKGRPKGSKNKVTKNAREAFQRAYEESGGFLALTLWAKANRTEFYKLYARLIPVEHVGSGEDGAIQTIVKHVYEAAKASKVPTK